METTDFPILNKRVEELESEVNCIMRHSPQEQQRVFPVTGDGDQVLHFDGPLSPADLDQIRHSVRRRIDFLRTLLCTEKYGSLTPGPKLNHINTRLSTLEAEFVDWVRSRSPTPDVTDPHDTSSSCSCTDSCINGVFDVEEEEEDGDDYSLKETIDRGQEEHDVYHHHHHLPRAFATANGSRAGGEGCNVVKTVIEKEPMMMAAKTIKENMAARDQEGTDVVFPRKKGWNDHNLMRRSFRLVPYVFGEMAFVYLVFLVVGFFFERENCSKMCPLPT